MTQSGNAEQPLKIGVVTVSDRAFRGDYQDRSGPAVLDYLQSTLASPYQVQSRLVDDDAARIESILMDLVDQESCHWVITTGGTGPAPRDQTPDVTAALCQRVLPGFGEAMRQVSLGKVPTAILSRQIAGIRNHCLLVNLPGSPKAIPECLDAIIRAVPDCLDQLGAPRMELNRDRFQAYRPHQ